MKPLLEAKKIEKMYGRQIVLSDLSFVVSEGAHIGLIGRNGSGKTTLLKILAGDDEADSGEIKLMPWTKLGVLRQHEVLPSDVSTSEHLQTSGKPEWECNKLASRFGLQPKDLALPPSALSGGYQMRVKLVRMLLDDPNLLLLDEPINYLDLPTMLLLESFLKEYPGAFLMTSHDREAMQNVCTATWEIERAGLTQFPGPVETYLDWKEEQVEYARRTNKRLRKEMADAQAFADRFRAKASLATRAQSKLKHITKLRVQLKAIGEALPTVAFKIGCPPLTSGTAVRCEELSIGYGAKAIAEGITFEIQRGEKVAIVGENGHGKTTLLKTLAEVLSPIAGTMKWWHHADLGYFSQLSEEALEPSLTVLQALSSAAPPDASSERILGAAGAFLFRDDDLEKKCGVLSGGEQARVRLARLVLQEHSVLILDEPTNHLDAETVEVLASALKAYGGTVILVSHARTFMNAIVDRVFEVHAGRVRSYLGSYEDYVAELGELADKTTHGDPVAKAELADGPTERHGRPALHRETKRAQQKLETKLKKLDEEKSLILAYFFENPTDYAPDKATRLSEIEDETKELEQQWLKLEEKIQ